VLKQLRQVGGVRQVKVENFKQGIFAVTGAEGARLSESALADAVRRSGFTVEKIVAPDGPAGPKESGATVSAQEFEARHGEARGAFRKGDYETARNVLKDLLAKLPDQKSEKNRGRSAEAGQLLALAEFASGDYAEASSAAHAALHRGKPWDWKTLSSHYREIKEYTRHLRALEKSVREEPTAENRFLLAYHYLMLGHKDAAAGLLERVPQNEPEDELVAGLLKQLTKP